MESAKYKSRRVPLRLLSVFSVVIVGLVSGVFFTHFGCGLIGGHWASASGKCITPVCFYLGGCGSWIHPPTPCSEIRNGTSLARVYVLLGNPAYNDGSTASWRFGKPDSSEVRATFAAGQLSQISCGNI